MTLIEIFADPFLDYGFMKRAMTACMTIAISGTPLGIFLVLRRMALMGEAISHAVLPGVAAGYWLFGLALLPMAIGGLLAGLCVAMLAGILSKITHQAEDASFTGLFTISLAAGVLMVSMHGSSADLLHILFGHVLAVDNTTLTFMLCTSTVSLVLLALYYRSLILECFDPTLLRTAKSNSLWVQQIFLILLVLNLVSAFQALGTFLAIGLMVLPAISARFWVSNIDQCIGIAVAFSALSSYSGLLLSFHLAAPTAPAIVLSAGAIYIISMAFGRHGSLITRYAPRKHLAH